MRYELTIIASEKSQKCGPPDKSRCFLSGRVEGYPEQEGHAPAFLKECPIIKFHVYPHYKGTPLAKRKRIAPVQPQEDTQDLGLGSKIAQQSRTRFLNRDGSFNVERTGQSFFRSLNPYHALLTMSWVKFHTMVVLSYFLVNVLFAFAYLACGSEAIQGSEATSTGGRFFDAFFFSVQTLATIGYGKISPSGFAANIVVAFEALTGLFGFALATGLLFARFSRPNQKSIKRKGGHRPVSQHHGLHVQDCQ